MFKGQLFIYIYKERELLKWREKVKAGAQDIGSVKETILREEVRNERLQVKVSLTQYFGAWENLKKDT